MYLTSKNIMDAFTDRDAYKERNGNVKTDGGLISNMHFVFDTFSAADVTIRILMIRYVHI